MSEFGIFANQPDYDQGPAIEAALQALSGTGRVLYLDAGTYWLHTNIVPGTITNTGLAGPRGAVLARHENNTTGNLLALRGQNTEDILVRGLTVDGRNGVNGIATSGAHNIAIGPGGIAHTDPNTAKRVYLEGVRSLRNPFGGFGLKVDGTINSAVRWCDIEAGDRNGASFTQSNGLMIASNWIHQRNLTGMAEQFSDADDLIAINTCDGVMIYGNYLGPAQFFHQGRNIWIVAGLSTGELTRRIWVLNNYMEDGYHANVEIKAETNGVVEHVQIAHNLLVNAGRDTSQGSSPTGDAVLISSVGDPGLFPPGDVDPPFESGSIIRHVTVEHNRIYSPRRNAVTIEARRADTYVEDVDIEHNRGFSDPSQPHVRSDSTGIANIVANGQGTGDSLGSYKRINEFNNRFHRFPGGGIWHDGTASNVIEDLTVDKSTIDEAGDASNVDGIYLDRIRHVKAHRNTVRDRRGFPKTARGLVVTNAVGEKFITGNDAAGIATPYEFSWTPDGSPEAVILNLGD